MIGLNRRREMGKPKMVMVEYLKSSGDAFIDTGITATSNTQSIRFKIRFEVPNVNRRILIGCYELNQQSINLEVYKSGSNNVMRTYSARGSSAINNVDTVALPLNKEIEVDATANFTQNTFNCEYTFEETSHTFNKSLVSGFTNTYKTFILFSDNRTGAGIRPQIANPQLIYSAQIYVDDVLVRDFIPVRIDQTGYMYDKVSGKLFDNKGTGTFILGQDIIPIQYLEKTTGNAARIGLGTSADAIFEITAQATTTLTTSMVLISRNSSGGAGTWFGVPPNVNECWGFSNTTGGYSNVSSLNKTNITLNFITDPIIGTIGSSTFSRSKGITSSNWTLFSTSNNGYSFFGRIYSLKVYISNNLTMDFIPVRINQTGYLYDKISNQLFGNVGTGDFILGPDKN